MTRIILLLLTLGIGVTARADVSDSGNLTIGGTGVIQGTMTVQGSAFSVGGTTFSVAGGSVTLGGRLNAAAAGIKWADGTTSTTAVGGGGTTTLPTRQIFSSGSGTYTTPASARQLLIRMVGGGGGGGGTENAIGLTANATVFGSTSAYGGKGGATSQTTGTGGLGGTGGASTNAVLRIPGNTGICPAVIINAAGANAPGNRGSGGQGGNYWTGTRMGCYGGDGEIVEITIASPASSYSYSVSTGANGTTGDAYNGGKGSTGTIIVDEFY